MIRKQNLNDCLGVLQAVANLKEKKIKKCQKCWLKTENLPHVLGVLLYGSMKGYNTLFWQHLGQVQCPAPNSK